MNQESLKQQAAEAALKFIEDDMVVGVGTGTTVNYFIQALASMKSRIDGAVASSEATKERLKKHGIPVLELNSVHQLPIYIDGADEVNEHHQLIKGGGGALTQEKILASAADEFICIIDESKFVPILGNFPLPVEVIPMARSYVARELCKLGGDPKYRENYTTDNGNIILDVYNLKILEPSQLEQNINQIPGVVSNGIFSLRRADKIIISRENGSTEIL